jgi:hypothetical protein
MSEKSPRHSMNKNPDKSIKEKRAIKKSKKSIAENDPIAKSARGEPGSKYSSRRS